ncbi:MAG: 4'-phosphopantetheinyl transferase family protein [Methylobacter sp.]
MYYNQLPSGIQQKILRYCRWQDRHAALFGRLLLKTALLEAGYFASCLELLQFDAYNRPSIDSSIDFNISHSGNYVLCAISKNGRIGIDIEQIKDINISYYKNFMSKTEWDDIANNEALTRRFYYYWTIKESVMKADGRGLSIPPQDIICHPDHATIYNKKWGLKEIPITDEEYCCHIAFENHDQINASLITTQITEHYFDSNILQPVTIFEISPITNV